ncbi:MAG: S41 family peptidase [Chitinophagaceae bacterium]
MQPVIKPCLLLVSLFFCLCTHPQSALLAKDIADSVQSIRNEARKLWSNKSAGREDLEKSIALLHSAFAYMDNLPARDLAQGNNYLLFRDGDISFDLLNAYTRNRQYDKALEMFSRMYDNDSPWFMLVAKDSVFEGLRKEPGFAPLLRKFRTRALVWQGRAFKTPFANDLSVDEKVAGLSVLWSQAKYNFVHFDRLTADWNQVYLDYLPLVRATTSTREYYKVLQQFYAQLQDGHSNVYPPDSLSKTFYSRPPLRTELLEGRVFITMVSSDSLLKTGIVPGLEILKIDGDPVLSYADKYVKPYQSSSTAQDLVVRVFSYYLLSGDAAMPLVLELKDPKGKTWSQPVSRGGYTDIKKIAPIEFKRVGTTGLLTINNFEDNNISRVYDSLFTDIEKTTGLIIDIRNNGGGDSYIGYRILSTLTGKPYQTSASKILRYDSRTTSVIWYENGPGEMQPDPRRFYDKPVIVLISARTFSAAEDFAVAFDYMKRGKLIGQATGGSTGQPVSFTLPGGGWARVCAKKDTYPDGKEFVGMGISPDITVEKTIQDMIKGTDAVLARAIAILNSN